MLLIELLSDDRAVKDEIRHNKGKQLKTLIRTISRRKNPRSNYKKDPVGDGPGDMSSNDDDEQRRSDSAIPW